MTITHLLSPADILWNILKDYGYDAESIFLEEGINREMILKPGMRIDQARVDSLWSKVNELIDDPCFGLRGANFWHPSHLHALWDMPGLPAVRCAKRLTALPAMLTLSVKIETIGSRIRLKG